MPTSHHEQLSHRNTRMLNKLLKSYCSLLQDDGGLIDVISHYDALADLAGPAGATLQLKYQVVG